MGNDVRGIALECLIEINEHDKYSHMVIGDTLKKYQYFEKQERAFFTRLCEGTIEYMILLDYVINQFSSVSVNKMKPVIKNLLRMSVYQIMFMNNVPDSAACNEAVKLAIKKGFNSLRGFVNGVLRNIARSIDKIEYPDKDKNISLYLSVRYSMPEWIVLKLLKAYGKDYTEVILNAFLKSKTTSICTNTLKISKNDLKNRLCAEGISVTEGSYINRAMCISDYDYLNKIEAFKEGLFFVQDESSMISVETAGIKKDDYIIDVCAAPGGKSMYSAMCLNNSGKISSRDISEYKIGLIKENFIRCGIDNVEVKVWDALEEDVDNIEMADVVIADLPCSGIGVIGQKADIKYKMNNQKQLELVQLQRKMLTVVSRYVKPGGTLIFSTCTINKQENEDNVEWFNNNFDFTSDSLDKYIDEKLFSDTTEKGYLQLLPGIHKTNGFFIARFKKINYDKIRA